MTGGTTGVLPVRARPTPVDSTVVQSTAADPLVGHVLEGRYRILARLAVGGMSVVYSGIDDRLDREVAVKVMTRQLSSDPVFVDRFAREARSAAKLSHVNAVSVYDQGSDGGNVFLVMELIRGRTLRDLIRERGQLSPAEAVSLMEPVLAALAAAHRAGLVHRDVKPENILLSDDGVVKVADFGLARAVEANSSSTRTGLMMGTVAYSSPEQFRGSSVDIRSDVYSAGIVFFELLTGQPPFHGPDAMAVAYQHVHSDVPPPSAYQRAVPPALDQLVRRVTARDPSLRPADAGTFLAELHDIRRELRLPILPVPQRPRTGPPNRAPAAAPPPRRSALHTARTAPDPRPPVGLQHTAVAPQPPGRPPAHPHGAPTPIPAPPAKKRRPRRVLRTVLGSAALLLVCALIILASWWWASGRYSSVSDVRNQPATAAVQALKDHGFKVVTDEPKASDTVPSGQVISTDPASGQRLVRGRTVHLVISSGPSFFGVPDVKSQPRAAAEAAMAGLQQKGVTVNYSEKADDTVAEGLVVTTTPAGGAEVKKGDVVTVVVSTGPPIINVADVTGKVEADATKTLTDAGFKVTSAPTFSDTVPAGVVISQNPVANTPQRKFATITITVSKGQDLVEVPALPNLDPVSDAKQRLEALGFDVKVKTSFGGTNGLVVGMDPAAGTKLKRGATVTVTIV
ncbi:MAG: spk [Pseudonocardiales bacterium]|nr:spk [Pseudonocardiales bacterium]